MENTVNYNLKKPGQDDFYNVTDFNSNADIIDGALKTHDSQLAQLTNPNLLINGDFKIWQRGTSFTDLYQKYSVDRWYSTVSANNFKVEKVSNGMKVTLLSGTNQTFHLFQKIEQNLIDFLNGKKVTVSLSVDNVVTSFITTGGGQNFGALWTKLFATTGESHVINWIKLELGSISTPFHPKSYAEELASCQRYYETFYHSERLTANPSALAAYEFCFPYKVTKRIEPVQSITSLQIEGATQTPSSYITMGAPNINSFFGYTSSNLAIGTRFTFSGVADAEIY